MKSVKKLEENSIYVLSGKAVAKNAFFETKRDVEFAHRYIMRYLNGMMQIQDYLFTPDGWILLVRTKSAKEIKRGYQFFRSFSKKAKEQHLKTDPSEMLSEHIRYFLSALVKAMNKANLRTGTKVHSVFERHIFDSYEECIAYMDNMRAEAIPLCEQHPKYRSVELDYMELQKIVGKGDVLLCSKVGRSEGEQEGIRENIFDLEELTKDVLRNLINLTICKLSKNSPLSNTPNSS